MTNALSIDALKLQRRWCLWRLEPVSGKMSKVPYQPNGRKAQVTNPANLHTYGNLEPHVTNFSGIGLALGRFDGVYVWGVDFDKCCDRATGKFTAETRQVVIDLDTYSEYSPSGEGAHCLGICADDLPIEPGKKGSVIVRPYPGCKQIEIKGLGFYFTFSGSHLPKTPATLMDRQEQVLALRDRVSCIPKARENTKALNVTIQPSEEERFQKLMAGDMSAHNQDHSTADFALSILLAKKHGCNAFKIDTEFRKSGLYREKWERDDYREATITRAILAVAKDTPIFTDLEEETFEDDGMDEYVVNAKSEDHEGWFPKGDISLAGGSSGTGKTYWMLTVLEKVRTGADVWGHSAKPRDYRVLMLDRGAKAMRRTLDRMRLPPEAKQRVIRVTSAQHAAGPVAVMTAATEREPGAEVWFVEGLDLWIKEANKMSEVAGVLDELQRLATRRNIAIIASIGSSKQKTAEGKDTEQYRGRETLFGSVAWGRKAETVVLISKTDNDPLHDDCPRQYSILVRNGRAEHFWMSCAAGVLQMVDRPAPREREYKGPPSKGGLLERNVLAKFKPGERILYSPELGVSEKTYYAWVKAAAKDGFVDHRIGSGKSGGFYMRES
ncbi:MAG: hypothetical protein WAK89_20340 [Candidatus Sulfotelmatobacter sp.]